MALPSADAIIPDSYRFEFRRFPRPSRGCSQKVRPKIFFGTVRFPASRKLEPTSSR